MLKRVSTFLFLITAATLLSDLSAQIKTVPAKFQQQTIPDSTSQKSTQPPDSLTDSTQLEKWLEKHTDALIMACLDF